MENGSPGVTTARAKSGILRLSPSLFRTHARVESEAARALTSLISLHVSARLRELYHDYSTDESLLNPEHIIDETATIQGACVNLNLYLGSHYLKNRLSFFLR